MTDFIYKIANGTAIYRGRVLNSVKYGTELVIGDIEINYSSKYFTIQSLENNNQISFTKGPNSENITFYYSINDGITWWSFNSSITWTLDAGSKIMLKASCTKLGSFDGVSGYSFSSTKNYIVYGNIMSLMYEDKFEGKVKFSNYTADRQFAGLFYNSTYLVDASRLILPVTTLDSFCYSYMFHNCSSLIGAPALPATTLTGYCYWNMFSGCTSLVTTPNLPATSLEERCYDSMFAGCTSLKNVSTLPASTLKVRCYIGMFDGCTSLEVAPVLPATEMKTECYYAMFRSCTSLREITCYASNRNASNCLDFWVDGVAATGDFYKTSGVYWAESNNRCPVGWTQHNI